MNPINSLTFFNYWKETVEKNKTKLTEIWRKSTFFTNAVFFDSPSILDEVAEKLGLECYSSNYYFLDAVFYENKDLVPGTSKNNFWLREIKIAFEHENYFRSGLFQEVSHLLITDCELRVLVTYPSDEFESELNFLHEIIKGNRNAKRISDEKSFLIIFGSETNFQWEGYYFTLDKWVKY